MDHRITDRRGFLLNALKASGQVLLASTAVYSVGVFVKSAVPDATMLAGAKTCSWMSTFAGVESSCTTGRCGDVAPDPCTDAATWYGCTSCGDTNGIVESLQCYCN